VLRALRQWMDLLARTRRLIARHPDLLPAFARWHRNNTTGTDFED
jgi:hypothetical protein